MSDIQLSNWNLSYGKSQVLFDINCVLPHGKVIVLLGSSGAGKTTLLRSLNFLERASSGTLTIAGQIFDVAKPISNEAIRKLRMNLGMVFQQYELWPHMTVMENLIYVPKTLKIARKQQLQETATKLVERLRISQHANSYPLQLSGGQQQRVAIARSLMMNPEFLLYDEPTAALDPKATLDVAQIIIDLCKTKVTQIIVTHDVGFAKQVADYVLFLENGHLIEQGGKEIFLDPKSEEFKDYLSHH